MIKAERAHSSKTVKTQKPSRVLFICIYDPIVFQLTNDLVYSKFSPYGRVSKVLIFERSEVTKLFVEFESLEDSETAKGKLDGTMLHNNYCKMNIFYSNLKTIDLRNRNSQGKDYSTIRGEKVQEFVEDDQCKTEKKTYDDFALSKKPAFGALDFSAFRSFKSDQLNVISAINDFRKNEMMPEGSQDGAMDDKIEHDIMKIIEEGPSLQDCESKGRKKVHLDVPQVPVTPALLTPKQSQIICFSVETKVPLIHVYNLFSNYGNIDKVVFKANTIYVQFENIEFAVIVKDYLQNMVLEENILRLSFANKADIAERANQYSERITFDSTFHRFSSSKSIAINPPSRVIHVSNLKRDACNVRTLTEFFEPTSKPDKIEILMNSDDKSMALVKFNCLEDSVRAISQLHNKVLADRKVQLSFTKSKI